LSRGFQKVYALKGGWREWEEAEYPIEQKEKEGSTIVDSCVKCHIKATPAVVAEWEASKHSRNEVSCLLCHGVDHMSATDVGKAVPVTQDMCRTCHETQANQFRAGKHAVAWQAARVIPRAHWQPMALVEGKRGCAACHKLGIKTQDEIKTLKKGGFGLGVASCDVCHSRHTFSLKEAREPRTCQVCHAGADHAQWEMFESSKHGIRYALKQSGVLPEAALAPTCRTCHMPEGSHEVRTAWGFWALRLPLTEDSDPAWTESRATILSALGMLDPRGDPTGMLDAVKGVDLLRQTREDWQRERDRMVMVCSQCHEEKVARQELERGDRLVRQTDLLMAEAIRIVAGIYNPGSAEKAGTAGYLFPDLLAFHDSQRPIEQRLFSMFQKSRSRTFQGRFHGNLEGAFQDGLGRMLEDVTAIRAMRSQRP